jgi:hypothetical protein
LKTAAPAGSSQSQQEARVARKTVLAALTSALAAAGCGAEKQQPAASETSARPPALYAVGDRVFGLTGGPARLARPPVAPLAGWLTPAAVPSPDGRYLAYNAWRELRPDDPKLSWSDQGIEPGDALATPSIRLYDASAHTDTVLEEGAFSLAWRADGAVAYFRGSEHDYRAGVPFVGDVVVRNAFAGRPELWSAEQARYVVVAWAGRTLIAYREGDGEMLDVIALDGPGRVRVLASDSALVALSPDGRRALVEQGPAEGRPALRVLDVATGEQEAELDLTTVDPAVATVGYAGDWRGDRVVASSTSGLAVFRIGRGSIELERTVDVSGSRTIAEPRFADTTGSRVTAWTSTRAGAVFLDCDLLAHRCERAVPLPNARGVRGFPTWRRPLYNPSRP